MNGHELVERVVELANDRPEYERYGQRLFNALYEIDSPTANTIRGTSADPFYRDDKAGDFFLKIVEIVDGS